MKPTCIFVTFAVATSLSGCAAPVETLVEVAPPANHDILYTPDQVIPGRLAYAPDRNTFPPILTERYAYPTQGQANDAYRRYLTTTTDGTDTSSLRLFGCKRGALDEQTARVTRYRGPVVHCAVDFLDGAGAHLKRETANFYYYGKVWNIQPVHPPRTVAPWRNRESSPKDFWRWIPGRPRYE